MSLRRRRLLGELLSGVRLGAVAEQFFRRAGLHTYDTENPPLQLLDLSPSLLGMIPIVCAALDQCDLFTRDV